MPPWFLSQPPSVILQTAVQQLSVTHQHWAPCDGLRKTALTEPTAAADIQSITRRQLRHANCSLLFVKCHLRSADDRVFLFVLV